MVIVPPEWNIFEKRNMAEVLDIITGNNINSFETKNGNSIKTAINMSNEEWQKMKDFELFKIGIKGNELSFEKHRNVKFKFEQSKEIIDNLSYKDWEIAKKRGLIDMTSDSCSPLTNYEQHENITKTINANASEVADIKQTLTAKIETNTTNIKNVNARSIVNANDIDELEQYTYGKYNTHKNNL